MGWKVGDTITIDGVDGPIPGRISALAGGNAKATMIMHYEYLAELRKQHEVSLVWCKPEGQSLGAAIESIEAAFVNSATPVRAFRLSTGDSDATSGVPGMMLRAGVLILLTTTVVATTIFAVALRERLVELAVLWALGFRRRFILSLLLCESVLLAAAGGVVGALVPFWLYHSAGLPFGENAFGNITVSTRTCAIAMALSLAMGILVGLVPSIRTIRGLSVRDLEGG
jgi:putative ABC transport system permease protein